jgi:hypothetical protein
MRFFSDINQQKKWIGRAQSARRVGGTNYYYMS